MKLVKITNPLWLGQIAPRIKDFNDRTKEPGRTYESLYTSYANSIQFSTSSEFTVVFDNGVPVAYAHWFLLGIPAIGSVMFESLHNWSKKREPVELLIKEFIEFGKRNKATVYKYMAYNEKVASIIEKYSADLGLVVNRGEGIKLYINIKKDK